MLTRSGGGEEALQGVAKKISECVSCGCAAPHLVKYSETGDWLCYNCWCEVCLRPLRRFGLTVPKQSTAFGYFLPTPAIPICSCKTSPLYSRNPSVSPTQEEEVKHTAQDKSQVLREVFPVEYMDSHEKYSANGINTSFHNQGKEICSQQIEQCTSDLSYNSKYQNILDKETMNGVSKSHTWDLEAQLKEQQARHVADMARITLDVEKLKSKHSSELIHAEGRWKAEHEKMRLEANLLRKKLAAYRQEVTVAERQHEAFLAELKADKECILYKTLSEKEKIKFEVKVAEYEADQRKANLKVDIEMLQIEHSRAKKTLDSTCLELGRLQQQRSDLEKEVNDMHKHIGVLKAEVKQLQNESAEVQDACITSLQQLEELEESINIKRNELKTIEEAAEETRKIADLRKQEEENVSVIISRRQEEERALYEAEKKCSQVQAKILELQTQADEITKRIADHSVKEAALMAERQAKKEAAERRLAEQNRERREKQVKANKSNSRVRQANKTIVIRRLSKSGNGDFGFSLEGGYDIDGLQPHVSKIDEFGPAAQSGLHVGDFIVSINAQRYVKASLTKILNAITVAGRSGRLSLSVHRDFTRKFLTHSSIALGSTCITVEQDSSSRNKKGKSFKPKLSLTPRRTGPAVAKSMSPSPLKKDNTGLSPRSASATTLTEPQSLPSTKKVPAPIDNSKTDEALTCEQGSPSTLSPRSSRDIESPLQSPAALSKHITVENSPALTSPESTGFGLSNEDESPSPLSKVSLRSLPRHSTGTTGHNDGDDTISHQSDNINYDGNTLPKLQKNQDSSLPEEIQQSADLVSKINERDTTSPTESQAAPTAERTLNFSSPNMTRIKESIGGSEV